jgi:hypothetical protein
MGQKLFLFSGMYGIAVHTLFINTKKRRSFKMNKNVKKALSSVLVGTMLVSAMTVPTVTTNLPFAVTSVYAATTDWTIVADDNTAGFEEGATVLDNNLVKVTAAQTLTVGGNPTSNADQSFNSHFKTSGINTTIDGSTYRLAFKIVTKKAVRITSMAGGGSKNAIFEYDEATGTYTNLTGNIGNNVEFYADVDAGKTVFIGNGGTNNSMYAVKVEAGPEATTVSTKLTAGNAAAVVPEGAEVTVDGSSVTVGADGAISFAGKTATTYTVAYVANGITYSASLAVDEDGKNADVLNLPVVAGNTAVTVKTADGTAVAGKKVTLSRVKAPSTPVVYTAVTDENGAASFDGIEFESYDVAIGGYTSATTTYQPTEAAPSIEINDATAIAYPALPAGASNDNIYVGYASTDAIKSYDSVQDAVDAATAGQTVYLAANVYKENVYIDKSLNFVGGTTGSTDKATITFNDSQGGNDSAKIGDTTGTKVRFHGDTVEITSLDAEVSFDNVRIENTAEEDLGVTVNATAIGAYGSNHTNKVTITNSEIIATRDTIYTGSSNASNVWTITNSKIAGFQDVVCGTGTIDITDCTWALNLNSDARFLVPNSGKATVMKATNLTITDETKDSFTKTAFLGRIWGDSSGSITQTQAIVDGYTDTTGAVPALDNTTYFSAYDTSAANKDKDGKTLADCNWLVRANSSDSFISTNTFDAYNADNSLVDDESSYRLVGLVSDYALENASEVGFVVTVDGASQTVKSDTVYNVAGDTTKAYTVAFINNVVGKTISVKSVIVDADGNTVTSSQASAVEVATSEATEQPAA